MRKFTLCLWLIILAAVRMGAQEQTINLPQEKIRLSAAFDLIEDQSGYTVAYNEMLLNVGRKVQVSGELALEDALKALLKGTGM